VEKLEMDESMLELSMGMSNDYETAVKNLDFSIRLIVYPS